MTNSVLLVSCPDEKGLIFKVTEELYQAGLNLEQQGEFVDSQTGHFFMRSEVSGNCVHQEIIDRLRTKLPAGAKIGFNPLTNRRLVILAGTEPHCPGELLLLHEFKDLPAEILAIISNHEDLGPLTAKFNVPFHFVSNQNLAREVHEQQVLSVLQNYSFEYLVTAKYMRILSDSFVRRYPQQIINIHHSFLPAFSGARPYQQAYDRGVKIIGATAHFVTTELDAGPIICQQVEAVSHRQSPADLARAGSNIEKIVLARALKLVLEERVFVFNNRTVIFE